MMTNLPEYVSEDEVNFIKCVKLLFDFDCKVNKMFDYADKDGDGKLRKAIIVKQVLKQFLFTFHSV